MLPGIYKFGRFEVDVEQHLVRRDGDEVEICDKTFRLFVFLLDNNGHLVKTQEILNFVWGIDNLKVTGDNLRNEIYNLRKILGETKPSKPKYLITKKGIGIIFRADDLLEVGKLTGATRSRTTSNDAATPLIAVVPLKFSNSNLQTEGISYRLPYQVSLTLEDAGFRTCHTGNVLKIHREDKDPIRIGKKLDADYVVAGIIYAGVGCVFVVQLFDVLSENILREERFEEENWDPDTIEDVICEKISAALPVWLREASHPQPGAQLDSSEVGKAYLSGRSHWSERTATSLSKAIEQFERAITLNPAYARAHAGLADCYNLLSYYSGKRPSEVFPKALEFANRAIELDPKLAEPYASRAYAISRSQWQWDEAEKEYERSIKLDKKYPTARQWYAEHLTAMGKFTKARNQIQLALALDPESPIISSTVGVVTYFQRNYEQAIDEYLETIKKYPRFERVRLRLARAYAQLGMFKEAFQECDKVLGNSATKQADVVFLGQLYAMAGHRSQAQKVLSEIAKISKKFYISEYNQAIIHCFLGDDVSTFRCLELAWYSRDPWLEQLKVDPRLERLRSNPRLRTLTKQIGLAGDE